MKTFTLSFIIVLFVGCGNSNSSSNKEPTLNRDAPKSPITEERGETPPSIPLI